MDWPIERKVQWGLGIAVAVLCSLGMVAYALNVSFVNTSNWVIHTHLVIETIQRARTDLDDAETSVRGYLLTQDRSFLGPFDLISGRIPGVIGQLRILISDDPAQNVKVAQLASQVARETELLRQMLEAAGAHPRSPAEQRRLLDEDQTVMSTIRNSLREIRLEEEQLLSVRDAAWRRDLTEAISAAGILGFLNFVLLGSIYYVFRRDLTERRRAEAALHASEERLRLMIASVKDYALFMLDARGCVATWNEGAAIIKGYEAGEIVGRPFSTFFPETDQKAGRAKLILEEAAKQGRVEDKGWRIRKDGSRFWADAITSAIRDHAGVLLGFSEVARDLTERQLAEERMHQTQARLTAILDGSPSVIFVKDPAGRYTLVNRKFEDSFRMTRDQVLGKTDVDLFPKNIALSLREHDAKVFEAGRALEFEEAIPQTDGLHTYLSARVPILGEDHEPFALCGVSTDITERKEREQEIQRLNRTLQDRVIDHAVELIQAADLVKMEREQRQAAEASEREVLNRLCDVMHTSTVPIWTYDLETLAILGVNNAAVGLYGSSREELSKLRMTDIFPPEEVAKLGRETARGVSSAERPTVLHHRCKSGRAISLGILARQVLWEGRDAGLVVLLSENEEHRVLGMRSSLGA